MKALIIQRSLLFLFASVFLIPTFAFTASAQNVRYYHADSGMVTLGPNKLLRVTVANAPAHRGRPLPPPGSVTFVDTTTSSTCSIGVCVHTVTNLTTTEPVVLNPGQAISYDATQPPGASAVRVNVRLTNPNVIVNVFIVDSTTGNIGGTLPVNIQVGDIN